MPQPDFSEFVNSPLTLAGLGEKEIIRRIVTPLFNPSRNRWSIGDDCALVEPSAGASLLVSTDRVPADLTAFQLGILDYRGLGRYLARLNLSDIAAGGGEPRGLLLNLGLPDKMLVRDLISLLMGAQDGARESGCEILGGDLSNSCELSISATAIGQVRRADAFSRQTAKCGDLVFISRPLGLTPAALHYYKKWNDVKDEVSKEERNLLNAQFLEIGPMFDLSRKLVASGGCSSCMDNTDGVGQSLSELAESSDVAITVEPERLHLPEIVLRLSEISGLSSIELAFSAGADFSLIGTMDSDTFANATALLLDSLSIIGCVEEGRGVYLRTTSGREPLRFNGWNYYLADATRG